MSGTCITKLPHKTDQCNSSDGLQVFLGESGEYTGYCFACDTYVPDPLKDVDEKAISKGRKERTKEEIQQEIEDISNLKAVDLPARKLRKSALDYYNVKIGFSEEDGKTPLYAHFPATRGGELARYKSRRLDEKKMWNTGESTNLDLFGWKQAVESGAKKLIICEGEFDAVALYRIFQMYSKEEYKHAQPAVVSVNNGVSSAAKDISNSINKIRKHFKDISICFDQDEAGKAAQEEICKKFPDFKAIELPCKDANEGLIMGVGKAIHNAAIFRAEKPKNTRLVWAETLHEEAKKPAVRGYSWPWPHIDEATKGIRLGETIYIGAGQKQGKSFGKGTPVRMYDGSVKMVQDVVAGDTVLGPDSGPRNVLSTHKGVMPLYRVDQKYGCSYVVNELHDLVLRHNTKGHKDVIIPAGEFFSKTKGRKGFLDRFKGYHVPAEYPEKEFPMCPYTFGVWLGDGTRGSPVVCLNLEDSKNILPKCSEVSYYKSSKPGTHCGWVKGAKDYLTSLDKVKHIPEDILLNSRRVRLEVLAGLIDTDGHKYNNNSWEIVTKSDELANSLCLLLRSLGCKVSANKSRKGIKSSEYSYVYNVLKFSGDLRDCPIQVPRKKCNQKPCKNPTNTGISICPVGEGEYFGFKVDGDSQFLLQDYTVVHNSELVNQLAAHFIKEHQWKVLLAKPEEANNKTYKMVAGKLAAKKFHDPDEEFDSEAYDKAGEIMKGKLAMINLYQNVDWDTLKQDIYAAANAGVKANFIDPITNLVNGKPVSEQNTELQRIAQEIAEISLDLNMVSFIFCHLRNPENGPPHERGGHVESSQFAGSRAMARSCNLMLGLEGNRDPNLDVNERNMRSLVLLEDREFGNTGRYDLFWDQNTTLFNTSR